MCCSKRKKDVDRIRKMFRERKVLTFWKVMNRCGSTIARTIEYGPGEHVAINYADKPLPRKHDWNRHYLRGPFCNVGIHVYEQNEGMPEADRHGMPVQCHAKDFLGAGDGQVVFRKVTILKKDWNKVFCRDVGYTKEYPTWRLRVSYKKKHKLNYW